MKMSIDEPIRVLNLFTIMNRGGAETLVMNYYRKIDKKKVQFDFVVHRKDRGAYDDEIEALGGRIYRMPAIRPWNAKKYCAVIDEFYKEHPEYRIIHSHMSELGYYDFIIAEKNNVPVRICHAHNWSCRVDIKSPFRWYYKKRMIPHITEMFVCGKKSGEWLFGKQYESKFVQMNNAIDASMFRFDSAFRSETRNSLGIGNNQLVIGHVGRFDKQKNHVFLIKIFEEIVKRNKNSILLLIGNDNCSGGNKIKLLVNQLGLEDRVIFGGTRDNIPKILQAMDVFVFPSIYEGFGIAALEAQAAGLPTFVSDRVSQECMVTDCVHSISLSNSPKYWADEILKINCSKRTDRVMQIMKSGYDIDENARWLQNFYLDLYEKTE